MNKGHYVIACKKPTVVSALAAIPKDDSSVRIIHDDSRPAGQAMNDYSVPESVKLQTLTDACNLAKPEYWCAKVDLHSAYRSVGIHPDNYCVTGLKWQFRGSKEPACLTLGYPSAATKAIHMSIDCHKQSEGAWLAEEWQV